VIGSASPDLPAKGSPLCMTLAEKLANLPAQPGCYLYRDKQNKILYVGKAKNLRNRVRHYFQATPDVRLHDLVSRIADVELFGLLPMPVLIMVAATILAAFWMRYSARGRASIATTRCF